MIQAKIDGFVLRNYFTLDKEQLIAVVMLGFEIYYDEALERVNQALNSIKGK